MREYSVLRTILTTEHLDAVGSHLDAFGLSLVWLARFLRPTETTIVASRAPVIPRWLAGPLVAVALAGDDSWRSLAHWRSGAAVWPVTVALEARVAPGVASGIRINHWQTIMRVDRC